MSGLSSAFSDLKEEVLRGADLTDALIAEIADDNGVHPALLKRKWDESGFTVEGTRATAAATTLGAVVGAKLEKNIERMCARYEVSRSGTFERAVRGITFTIICRFGNCRTRPYLGVSHADGRAYRLSI